MIKDQSPMTNHQLSIGMPVYNGEPFLRQALDAILTQTYENFELIISDNASTDGTESICREYASRDRRIRYYRHQINRGAAWNHNYVWQLSSGKYFKWLAHDDLYKPDFLSKCIEVLEEDPEVVLCHSQVQIIDSQNKFIQNYEVKLNTDSSKPHERFHALLSRHLCYPIFGVIRASTLKMMPPIGNYGHADGVFLLRLGLLGRFHEIPEYLFLARHHPQQSMSRFIPNHLVFASQNPPHETKFLPDFHAYAVWFDPNHEGKILFPHWRLAWEYWKAIWQTPLTLSERLCCHQSMSQQLQGTEYLLLVDLAIAAQNICRRFFSILGRKLSKPSQIDQQENSNLKADVEQVLTYQELIKHQTNNRSDSTRILGVVAATHGAEKYLPITIPQLLQQISEIGLGSDIIIGLNNGFECQAVIERFTQLPDVQIVHLYTEEKLASTTPASIFDNYQCSGAPYCLNNDHLPVPHRIFVVHQRKGAYSAGKIRILGDIYHSLILKSIAEGWLPPEILFTFDAESEFLVNHQQTIPQPDSNGLQLIVKQLQNHPELDILGTNNRYVVYQQKKSANTEVWEPNFDEELPPIPWFLNLVHGKYRGFQWKPGGGTFARTGVLISLLATISQKYPGTRNEDVQLTVLAKHAGFCGDILIDVISTNRVPSPKEIIQNKQQLKRWIAANYALEINYGKNNVRELSNIGIAWNVWFDPISFWQRIMAFEQLSLLQALKQKTKILIAFSWTFFKIRQQALKNPDVLQGSQTKASW